MCGIAGFIQAGGAERAESLGALRRMAAALGHRGPDDEGFWVEPQAGVALAHRRLSIIDLSPLGHQPMVSTSGRYTITYNGEIYNHNELRAQLLGLGHGFRGGSDTEVLLGALEEWGLEATLARCRGMFAFAVWDRLERTLHLVRDRFGEKPLYYGVFARCLVFGSELKALVRHDSWRGDIDRGALALLLRHSFIPAPHTIFRGVHKVRAGCVLSVRAAGDAVLVSERAYWQPPMLTARSQRDLDPREHVDETLAALQDAIRLQMVADVPVGAFLSGGIDSSLVVSLMQHASSRPVKTYSIGFAEREFDETPFARRIARHLGTDHTELVVSPSDALAVIPQLPRIYDEPFADPSQIPTFLVARLARKHVTVSLSGDAGDELFGGYGRYGMTRGRWRHVRRVPLAVRRLVGRGLDAVPHRTLERMAAPLAVALRAAGHRHSSARVVEWARMGTAQSLEELYRAMISYWQPPARFIVDGREPEAGASQAVAWPPDVGELAQMMYLDTRLYLPDDILVKVDRAAMAVSLETRIPLLDPKVAEVASAIPAEVHTLDGRGKWVLRTLLERYVPRTLFERRKRGFAVPIARWLRHELREWAGDLLRGDRLRADGFFVAPLIERRWREHLSGKADWSFHLWTILMFQAWLDENGRVSGAPSPGAPHLATV
jgi:asparagine synthase (glutamine-hydrolysing)